ncbi:bifunctional oligoribonuclease/PAP phosphatase NrnA [Candidatus Gracilibacteria bacterium]|nr:bifunctional oligoribonuclease/PAP phosphatase NrnA [Candidatus Gracilibacteria bacterium]
MQNEIQKLGELIHNSHKILLINHIRMDGDAWGSLGGLALILKSLGKEVVGINDCPVPPFLDFLGNTEIVQAELDVEAYNPDLIISLDAADEDRLGNIYKKYKKYFQTKTLVVIDHHISNPAFGNLNIIDTKASSVCEMMVQIIVELGLESHVSPEVATFFYTGLQTDTNMYFTNNTRKETLLAGAKLIELGADFRLPIEKCFKSRSIIEIELWKIALRNLKQNDAQTFSYSSISVDDLRSITGINKEDIGGYLKGFINDVLINIEGTKIAFLLYPLGLSENKVSMRSQSGYDVNAICQTFGGGGHLQASGFQSIDSQEEIIQKLLKITSNILD